MYPQNQHSQSTEVGERVTRVSSTRIPRAPANVTDEKRTLPQYKLITTGNGRVYPVDENGSLVKYTDNSAIVAAQGFQRIKERFKLLNSARKILKGERTQHCFYNRIEKTDGVGVMFNKYRNKANFSNVMRCANSWGCPVCAAIISEYRKMKLKRLWTGGLLKVVLFYYSLLQSLIIPIPI